MINGERKPWAPEVWPTSEFVGTADGPMWVQDVTNWTVTRIWDVASYFRIDEATIVYNECGSHKCLMVWPAKEGDHERTYEEA